MPRIPRGPGFNGLSDLKFITNYFVQGCSIPLWAEFDVNAEPFGQLFALYLGLDGFDLAQNLISPRSGRGRRPGRHGRKSGRGFNFPDPNDLLAQRIKTDVPPIPAQRLGPLKFGIPLLNVVEFVNFQVAIAEVGADGFLEGIYGVLEARPEDCPEFSYLTWTYDGNTTHSGLIPNDNPVNWNTEPVSQGFVTPTQRLFRTDNGDYSVSANGRAVVSNDQECRGIAISVNDGDGTILEQFGPVDRGPGEVLDIFVSAEQKAGRTCFIGLGCDGGVFRTFDLQMRAHLGTYG